MEVIPISLPNSAFAFRRIRMHTLFIINARLAETPLKNALNTLIRDHWRLLGARIVGDLKKPHLSYHLPETFPDDNYDLFKWSSEEIDFPIDKALPQLNPSPSQSGKVTVLPLDPRSLAARFSPREWPFQLSDAQDEPFLFVKLTLFTDATVLSLSIPHIVCDALGLASLIRAWLGLVEGKTPPVMIGTREDLLPGRKPFAEYAREEVTAKGRTRLKGRVDGVLVPLGFVPQLVRNFREERTVVLFPTGVVQRLRERIARGFVERGEADPGLTNSDVVTAILAKFSRMDTKKKHMLSLSQTVNLRRRIPELSDPNTTKGYIHNSIIYATSRFRFDHDVSLGDIARRNRESISRTLQPDTIDLYMAISRELTRRAKSQHICEPLEKSFHVTNWSSAWRRLDFTPALEGSAVKEHQDKTPRVLVLGESMESRSPCRFNSVVMCKTEEGYWVSFSAAEPTLKAVRKYLADDPELKEMTRSSSYSSRLISESFAAEIMDARCSTGREYRAQMLDLDGQWEAMLAAYGTEIERGQAKDDDARITPVPTQDATPAAAHIHQT
ncbi:hypothetical protein QBC34DRAFT_425170 [Podospora aff. communis PSN243]|uniref:Uncharacterized protein n=1 Tax=Podospora aff. communis PSN243 TaxID=3040156 RepID=A0AAV9GNG2_9PEZI|nr:hypothetical protein QBC34DRAFT_425170 [Podospora aff. communis PSN243]